MSGSADDAQNCADFLRDDSGATAIEYALIASGIAGAIIVVVFCLGHVGAEHVHERLQRPELTTRNQGFGFSPAEISRVPSASASRCVAEPGLSGFCWLSCGAQPDSHTISKVARRRPSASAKRSA